MSSQIILFLCFGFVIWLFRKDMAWRSIGSRALLIPGAWLAIQGSRPVSYWFGVGGGESSPINTLSFGLFLLASVVVLAKRGLDWGRFIRGNKALCLAYLYLLLSVCWSEQPGASLKRLIKDFETVLVALVLLSHANLPEVLRTVYMRVSYLLFPLSVVFIKFFPEIGRSFSRAGEAMFGGVTTQKNSLGLVVFVFSIIVLWDLVEIYKGEKQNGRNIQLLVRGGLLAMGLWLLRMCDSQTSLLCLMLGAGIYWVSQLLVRMRRGKSILIAGLTALVCLMVMDKTFGLSDMVIRAMGRDPSLTGRTDIWRLVLEQQQSPLTGYGFSIFWDSKRGKEVVESFMQINSAHNGYLDLYLDGGLVGTVLLGLFLLAAGRRVINRLFAGNPLGSMGLIYWFLAIVYNMSESSFFRLDVLWFTFLLTTIKFPEKRRQPETRSATHTVKNQNVNWDTIPRELNGRLAHANS